MRWLLLVAMLSACGAQMNARPDVGETNSQYGPVSQPAAIDGEVEYALGGLEVIENGRREDAYKQMFKECSGTYAITREENKEKQTVSVGPLGGGSFPVTYRVIHFKCVSGSSMSDPPHPDAQNWH